MRLEDAMRQKTGQLELLPKNRGEAHGRRQSGEVSTASKGTERSGTDDTLLLMEQVVERRNAIEASDVTSTLRTAGCGPARPVVWEGPGGGACLRQPLPDNRNRLERPHTHR